MMMKKLFILIAILSLTSLVSAQVGLNGVGIRLGYVDPEDMEGTLGVGTHMDLGTLMPNLGLFAYLDYWGKSEEGYGFESSLSVIDIAAIVKYQFSTADIKPYVGGGLGLNIATAEVEVEGWGSNSESETDISIHLLGGVAKKFSPEIDGFAEIKYSMSDGDWLTIQVGVTYSLK